MTDILKGEKVFTSCTQGGPVFVHVKDGKIVRIRPIVFDDNEEVPTWTIKAHGREFSAPRRVTQDNHIQAIAEKSHAEP